MKSLSLKPSLLQDDHGLSAGSGGLPKVRQNRKERDQITGEEPGDQPDPDADPEAAGHGIEGYEKKGLVQQPPPGLGLQAFGQGAITEFLV
jgi:hypothetical protein